MRKTQHQPTVVQIHPNYLGLSEIFIHRLVSSLNRWRPIVLTERAQNGDYFGFHKQYQVVEVGSGGNLFSRIWSKLIRFIRPVVGSYYSTHAMYSQALFKIQPALLHAHFGPTGWFAVPLKRLHRLPLVVSFHGQDASVFLCDEIWRKRYQEMFAVADAITTPTEYMARRLKEAGCPDHKLCVLHYGIDLEKWRFQPKFNQNNTYLFDALFVGRLVEKKGVIYALEAIDEVRRSFPGVRLHIAGDGELRSEVEQVISDRSLGNHVKLLGFVSNAQIQELMRTSDVLIAPSITATNGDEEGLPNVLLEAAAVGLPIVATQHAGIPELIRDGISGFLVPERDSQALAKCLMVLIEQPHLRLRFAQLARQTIETRYNLFEIGRQLELLFDDLCID